MPLIRRVVRTFPEEIALEKGVILSDGDNTLFHPRSLSLHDETQDILRSLTAYQLTLVTASPQVELTTRRAGILRSIVPLTTIVSVLQPERAVWNKFGLYATAVDEAKGPRESFTVIGDRWLMDVRAGQAAVRARLPDAAISSYCVRRAESRGDIVLDQWVRRAEHVGFAALPSSVRRIVVGEYPS